MTVNVVERVKEIKGFWVVDNFFVFALSQSEMFSVCSVVYLAVANGP